MCCVGSTQQPTPHEKAPQPPANQNRVRRGDSAGAMPGACPDVGWHLTGRAAYHHVLHRQDHQVSPVRSYLLVLYGVKVVVFWHSFCPKSFPFYPASFYRLILQSVKWVKTKLDKRTSLCKLTYNAVAVAQEVEQVH